MNMKTIKVSEATPKQLDWLVAVCEGKQNDCEVHAGNVLYGRVTSGFVQFRPSTDWARGGAIIERERITLRVDTRGGRWVAFMDGYCVAGRAIDPTPLVAAMRCYVTSNLGETAEVPGELT